MMRTSKETISGVLYTLKVAALIILELKKGGGGGEWGLLERPQSQAVKNKRGLDRANLPYMLYSHCHLIS